MATKLFTRIDGTQELGEVNEDYYRRVEEFKKLLGDNFLSIDVSAMIDAVSGGDLNSIIANLVSVALSQGNAELAIKIESIRR